MEKNIVLDFSTNKTMENMMAGQPLALLPAELAKKLLKMYAENLQNVSAATIIDKHMDDLMEARQEADLPKATEISLSWLQERELIDNVMAKNWSAYDVRPEAMVVEKNRKGVQYP